MGNAGTIPMPISLSQCPMLDSITLVDRSLTCIGEFLVFLLEALRRTTLSRAAHSIKSEDRQSEEKIGEFFPIGESWDKKMKGKRSAGEMDVEVLDGNQKGKRALPSCDACAFGKTSHPPPKKLSDCKTSSHQGHAQPIGTSDFKGEADDDWKELLAAANYAPNASYLRCSNSFWKKMEPYFAPISLEDTTYLHQQLTSLEELEERFCNLFGTDHKVQDELVGKEDTLSQAIVPTEREGSQLSRTLGSSDQSLYQRVLSAYIEEEEIEELDHNGKGSPASFEHASDNSPSDGTCIQNLVDGIPVNGDQYQNMCLDDRILLELQSIGLYPEKVPDIMDGKEEIDKDIVELEKTLYQQAKKMKGILGNLFSAVEKAREAEQRNLEQIAMDKLVMMAYIKYSRVISQKRRGRKSSRGRVSKGSKTVVLAFVKRTLERCQKFEETGISCFSEPPLRDIILSAPRHSNGNKFVGNVRAGSVANAYVEAHNSRPDYRISAVGVASKVVELHDPHDDKHNGNSSDAFQGSAHSSDFTFANSNPKRNRRKKNVILGDGASRASPVPRDQNKDKSTSSFVPKAKCDCPTLGTLRDECKTEMKYKRKTRLSTSKDGLLGGFKVTTHPVCPSVHDSSRTKSIISNKGTGEKKLQSTSDVLQGSSKESEKPIDSTNTDLNKLESVELGITDVLDGHQDLSSWLNFDGTGLKEDDSMGLEVPMDDLWDLDFHV